MARQQLRIISGCWRGHRLQLPQLEGVRPTPERIRETLFNWLAGDIIAACCLDLYAGSGALGWEALSRGASEVIFVERSRQVCRFLKATNDKLNCQRAQFFCREVLSWLQACTSSFDIIFADPPFYRNLAQKSLALIQSREILKPQGYCYIEVERNYPFEENLLSGWQIVRYARAGEATGWLLQQIYTHRNRAFGAVGSI